MNLAYRNKKMAAAAAVAATLMVSACSSGTGNGGEGGSPSAAKASPSASAPAKPVDISVMAFTFASKPPESTGDTNAIGKEIIKHTNVNYTINWVNANNYKDKLNVMLASGDLPDLTLAMDAYEPTIRRMALDGAFWDLTPYISQYPHLARFPKQTWDNTKINGKNYGIPNIRPLEGGSYLNIRKDWLDKLGLPMPKTMDDFYKVLKAFTKDDPDGNGKADTFGFTNYPFYFFTDTFLGANTSSSGGYKLKDGKLVNAYYEPEFRQGLVWLANAYKEGLMPPDYVVMKDSQHKDFMKTGKAGVYVDPVNSAYTTAQVELNKTFPKAVVEPIPYLEGPSGKFAYKDSGFYGMFLIPKSVPEEKLKRILAFCDFLASDLGSDLQLYGIKDVHYTEKDGIKTINEKFTEANFGFLLTKHDQYGRAIGAGMTPDIITRNKKIIDERSAVSVPNHAIGLFSETGSKVGSEYKKKSEEIINQVIMGKSTIEEWDKYVQTLKGDATYNKITDEINQAYQARLGK